MQKILQTSLAAAAVALCLGANAQAATITLPLGNLHTGANIDDYFNGGSDSVPNDGTGPNLGFTFSANATVQKAGTNAATGAGKFENNPSGQSEILYFAPTSGLTDTVNFAAGFSGVSFNYSIATNSD